MSAGIAGVARMIERLDLTSKKAGGPDQVSSCGGGTTNSAKGKGMLENMIIQSFNKNIGKVADEKSSDATPYTSGSTPGRLDVSPVQVCCSDSLLLEKQVNFRSVINTIFSCMLTFTQSGH